MTFSIVARDAQTGDLGIALASKFLAAGPVTMFARAGVGAVATQALANTSYGPRGLALLEQGLSAPEAVERLTGDDDARAHRQLGIVDAAGHAATFTGEACLDWAGGRLADGVAAQGNILAGPSVVDALVDTFEAGGVPFPELLVACLQAADDQGGDRRGRQSASLLIVRQGGGYGGFDDRWLDLRVDDHPAPIGELARLLDLSRLYRDRPSVDELLPIDEALAGELRALLATVGHPPGAATSSSLVAAIEELGVVRTGEPREAPASWDPGCESALAEWMAVENLEERAAARGWIDPRVMAHLRAQAAST